MTDNFEKNKFQDLESLQLLDTLPEKAYDDITSLAAYICNTPISLVSLVTESRQFFKSRHGLDISELPIELSFCTYALKAPQEFFIVEDARKDKRFKNNPIVTEKPNIVFYVGIPLISGGDNVLGTLCVIDHKPRKLEPKQLEALKSLANQVVHLFELRKNRMDLKEIGNNLAVQSQRLSHIIDVTRIGTWEWDVSSDKIIVNERWAEMLGYTLSELSSMDIKKFQNFIIPKEAQSYMSMIDACFKKRSEFCEGDHRFLHKNGSIVWIHVRGQVVSWSAKGLPLLMAGTHTDITERKNTETQFNIIANNIPGAVFRYMLHSNETDELQLVSDGATKLWGFSAKEVMRNNDLIWERYDKKDLKTHRRLIRKSAENLSFWEHEWRYHHPDGKIHWQKGFGNPIRIEDGNTIWDSIVLDITSDKENELEIEQSEMRFKALVQNGSDLIAILDFEANYHYVSPTSTTILGIPPEVFIGKNAFEFIHQDDKESVNSNFLRLKTQKQIVIKPFRFKHGDGSWRWVETIVLNLMDNPAVNGLVANSRDVTERILTQKKLIKSEAYYRGLYESQTNYVIRTDMEGNYTYTNKKFVEEFGWMYPDSEILGKSCMPSIMDYDHKKTQEIVGQCISEPGKVFKIEIDKPYQEGKILTTLWDFLCITDPEGIPSEIQCIGLDISERVKSEKALKESEKRYSDLYQLSPQPMWVYDMVTLEFLDVNNAAIQHYGYSYKEFMNMTLREIRPKSEISKLETIPKHRQENGKYYFHGEYIHKKKNGEEIIVGIRTNKIFYKGNEAKVALVIDITERVNHIRAIEAQNKKLKEIAWTQSHEVRAPLARIMGLVALLKAEDVSVVEKEQILNYLMVSANELDTVIGKIVNTAYQE